MLLGELSHGLDAKAVVYLESGCLVRSDGPYLKPVNADTRTAASSVAPEQLEDDGGRKSKSSIGFCVQDIAPSACSELVVFVHPVASLDGRFCEDGF